MRRHPILMIGVHGAVATTVIRQKMIEIAMSIKGQQPVIEMFRLVTPAPVVHDILCENYQKANFLAIINEIGRALWRLRSSSFHPRGNSRRWFNVDNCSSDRSSISIGLVRVCERQVQRCSRNKRAAIVVEFSAAKDNFLPSKHFGMRY